MLHYLKRKNFQVSQHHGLCWLSIYHHKNSIACYWQPKVTETSAGPWCLPSKLAIRYSYIHIIQSHYLQNLLYHSQTIKLCPTCSKATTITADNKYRCQRKKQDGTWTKSFTAQITICEQKGSIKIDCIQTGSRCNFKLSIRSGTWLMLANLPLDKTLIFTTIYLTGLRPRQALLQREAQITAKTTVSWSNRIRLVLMMWALKHSTSLGGVGKIVEIDESMVNKSRFQSHCRKAMKQDLWAFGGVERDSGKSFFILVKKRDTQTLMSIIKRWILPG